MKRKKVVRRRKPVIGITCEVKKLKPYFSEFDLLCDYRYVRAILRAGGIPVLIPIIPFPHDIGQLLHHIDGIVITGGADIPPAFYGEKATRKVDPMYRGRIYFEKSLFQAAQRRKIPVFAICYGMQLLNVLHGGTLCQDIQTEIKGAKNHRSKKNPLHRIKVMPGSLLRRITRHESFLVHSEHHQAIKTPGRWMNIIAFSEDGIPEAIQGPPRTLAVQWHPERQPKDPVQSRLFRHFIKLARSRFKT
ncbi:MAG: gamma-glutamyl-gamma-aminobutyrate hydrolase family protein [Candidatus Omnitrophica bacterium]|nr:gamma-glutamyl-gamma-aminobutyrate hydrolase family protein [Candidatus Omnitrophota bacterium]